jgi:epoxyqueuosine reductase
MSLSAEIKEAALNLGFCKAGITTADDFTAFIDELLSRGELYDHWVHRKRNLVDGARPRKLMPSAKSIIVTAFDYAQKSFPEKLLPMIGRIYMSRSYQPKPNTVGEARLRLFKEYLESKGCAVNADMYLPVRQAAARAGVASFGRNNFSYVDGIGSFVILHAFVVDKELDCDTPSEGNKCPPGCDACIKSCPTQALIAPFKLAPHRCVGFNNWKRQDGLGDSLAAAVPREIRERIGVHFHGCDVCQEVCPRNKMRMGAKLPHDEFLELIARDFSLSALLRMPPEFYRTRVYPIMHNYISEIKYFQRNAAIAMGNTGDRRYVQDLTAELDNPEALVRGHVAWALGRLGGREAREALERRAAREDERWPAEEIQAALEYISP